MTDRFKIVRIRARNVPHTRTQAAQLSLVSGKRQCRVLMRRGAVLLKHKKSSRNNLRMSGSGL